MDHALTIFSVERAANTVHSFAAGRRWRLLAHVVSMTCAMARDSSHGVSSGVSESDFSDHVDRRSSRDTV
jgi:hypothetical protein